MSLRKFFCQSGLLFSQKFPTNKSCLGAKPFTLVATILTAVEFTLKALKLRLFDHKSENCPTGPFVKALTADTRIGKPVALLYLNLLVHSNETPPIGSTRQ